MCWTSLIINYLSTVVITETSEGHMGCNRPLSLVDREIRITFYNGYHAIYSLYFGNKRQDVVL